MTWSQPDFVEITLNMEVTGYVNTDEETGIRNQESAARNQKADSDSCPLTPEP